MSRDDEMVGRLGHGFRVGGESVVAVSGPGGGGNWR